MRERENDSFTIGTPATGGSIKVYGQIGTDEFAKKIDRAIMIYSRIKKK